MEKKDSGFLRREYVKYFLWYTLLFIVTSCGVFYMFILKRKSFCWTTDAVSQYVPKLIHFMKHTRGVIAGLLSGNPVFPLYDFALGMGDGVQIHTEPVYWLSLLFPESHGDAAYTFLTIVRFYLAGLSMSAFLLYFKKGKWESLIASMLYIYSMFGLYGGMRHGHFIVPMITLPLMLLGIEEIYRHKRWYICTLTVALSLWCGYYFTYMNTIAMGIYFLIRFFLGEREKSVRVFFRRVGTIVWTYLLGVMIGNLTLFNTFADFLTSSRTTSNIAPTRNIWFYGSKWGIRFFRSFISTAVYPGEWMMLGFIPLMYLLVVLMFLRKGRKQLKTAFLCCLLFGMVPLFGIIFSGFGDLTNRWSYMFSFVMALIAADMLKEVMDLKRSEKILLGVSMTPYLLLMIGDLSKGGKTAKASQVSGIVLMASYLVVLLLNTYRAKMKQKSCAKTAGRTLLLLTAVGSLWIAGLCRFSPLGANMIKEFAQQGKVLDMATDMPLKAAAEIEDESFYRSMTTKNSSDYQGASMILGHKGVVQYASALNKNLVDFYREMGVTTWSLVRLRGFDKREYLNALAAVKYYLMEKEEVFDLPYGYTLKQEIKMDEKTYEIFEREHALPLGYTYDQVISAEELEQYDTEQRQEVMLQAAALDDTEDTKKAGLAKKKPISITGKKIPVSNMECTDVEVRKDRLKVLKKNGIMTLTFEGMEGCETYLVFRNMKLNRTGNVWMKIQSGDTAFRYCYHGDKSTYTTSQKDYIFNLGYHDEGKTQCTVSFDVPSTMKFDEMFIYCQPVAKADEYIEARSEEVLEQVVMEDNSISGTISLEKEKLLALSIPYQAGWSAYVDGVKTEIEKVNLAYMGIFLTPGEHTVELHYTMPGLKLSLILSAAGILIFITALMIRRKRTHAS